MFRRLVRPVVVIALDEAIELGLLLQHVLGRWLSRFPLQRQMDALMTTVLLRVTGLEAVF
jgi:hypothetical protein